jgi:hypothetical protein
MSVRRGQNAATTVDVLGGNEAHAPMRNTLQLLGPDSIMTKEHMLAHLFVVQEMR